jgi:signal transduction histidine kinase
MTANQPSTRSAAVFRTKLSAAMMLIVVTLTALGLYLAQRKVAADAEQDLQQNFQAELSTLHKIEELRHASLVDRCAALAARPRIHAALEDNALDLLYPSAKDELRDLTEGEEPPPEQAAQSLHARFYRFLNSHGAVLPPPKPNEVGELGADAELQLSLPRLSDKPQIGYVHEIVNGATIVDEVISVPIFSTETGEVISALVIGFKPLEIAAKESNAGMKSGICLRNLLHLPSISGPARKFLGDEIAQSVAQADRGRNNFRVIVDGAPQLLFYKQLNPGSLFPPAYEVCIYPLTRFIAQLSRLRWQIGGAGALLLLGGFVTSHIIAARLAVPVEKLALDSEENRARRKRAEAALATTTEELQRSTRYSADASHQLKSPVTVLRTGIETLLARDDFKSEVYEELSALLHQTHRLSHVIDDLLLLSRMDAGHLQLAVEPVNLSALINEWLDDLSALPDAPEVRIDKNYPADLFVAGEHRYTSLIVQNLLENARKYNRPGGRMQVSAEQNGKNVVMRIANTGNKIAEPMRVFERFHRDAANPSVSGHGIGLNLARELTRLHGGDLCLVRAENDWTEFEVRFCRSVTSTAKL